MKENLNKVYAPVLKKIYSAVNTIEDIKGNPDIPDIFIPGVGKLYTNSNKKILYIGKDTNGWYSMKESASKYALEKNEIKKQELLEGIISRASNDLQLNKHVNEWWGDGKSKFWDYIFKLQMYINNLSNIEESNWSNNETTELQKEWLQENEEVTQNFAWANTKLLQELNLDKEKTESYLYKEVSKFVYKKKEERNEIFRLALEALQPDIIIILNWDEYLTFIGNSTKMGTYYDEYKGKGADNQAYIEQVKIEYYKLDSGQDVFWTYHPQGTVYRDRGGVGIWVRAMFKFMKDKKVI